MSGRHTVYYILKNKLFNKYIGASSNGKIFYGGCAGDCIAPENINNKCSTCSNTCKVTPACNGSYMCVECK